MSSLLDRVRNAIVPRAGAIGFGRAVTFTPFSENLRSVPADKLSVGPREIPVGLVAALVSPSTSGARKLELARAMAVAAADRGAQAEHALTWYLALDRAVSVLAAEGAVAPADVQPLRWRVIECAARVGLAHDVRRHAAAALAIEPLTPSVVHAMIEWRPGSRDATTALLDILNNPVEGADREVANARRHFTNFLREFSHAS